MHVSRTLGRLILLSALISPLAGCASLDRKIFNFNMNLGSGVLKPLSQGWHKLPTPVRTALRNVTDNIRYTETLANNLLQGKVDRAATDVARIAANTVMGFGGVMDPATDIGIPRYQEDFGQTLGRWGLPAGPYFNVPGIGPSSLRDVWRYPAAFLSSPFFYVNAQAVSAPVGVMGYLFERWDDVDALENLGDLTGDRYVFVRDAYLQHRLFLITDGNPPTGADEKDIDEALDDADLEGLDDLEEGVEDGLGDPPAGRVRQP